MNLVQRADSLFSKLCRVSRADEAGKVDCICCGQPDHWGGMDPAHFVGRSCMALRWDLDNVWPCHRICHNSPDHLDRYEATLIQKKGKEFVEGLRERGHRYTKAPTEAEIEELIVELEQKLSVYGNNQGVRGQGDH